MNIRFPKKQEENLTENERILRSARGGRTTMKFQLLVWSWIIILNLDVWYSAIIPNPASYPIIIAVFIVMFSSLPAMIRDEKRVRLARKEQKEIERKNRIED